MTHRLNCTGCPFCDPQAAAFLEMTVEQKAAFLSAQTSAACRAAGAQPRTLRGGPSLRVATTEVDDPPSLADAIRAYRASTPPTLARELAALSTRTALTNYLTPQPLADDPAPLHRAVAADDTVDEPPSLVAAIIASRRNR